MNELLKDPNVIPGSVVKIHFEQKPEPNISLDEVPINIRPVRIYRQSVYMVTEVEVVPSKSPRVGEDEDKCSPPETSAGKPSSSEKVAEETTLLEKLAESNTHPTKTIAGFKGWRRSDDFGQKGWSVLFYD